MLRLLNTFRKIGIYVASLIFFCCSILSPVAYVGAQSRWSLWSNPTVVLDRFASRVNTEKIQDNALNDTSNIQWQYSTEYKISNTLDAIRNQITPYIQRTMYIGLAIAVILIIYNGLLMVTNSLHDQWDLEKIKWRLKNILIWVGILTWFYVIIQLSLAIIDYILQ